ncbi:MAG: DUF5597 domain-containing protein [Massilibacteroides sp.]|nr:DUF5597 domain-containing protein [Massilibacteroides sp.]
MKKFNLSVGLKDILFFVLSACFVIGFPLKGQVQTSNSDGLHQHKVTPYLKVVNGITRMMVDDEPFVMLGGELHNSTSTSEAYFGPLFSGLKNLNLNMVIGSVSWEQFEPTEGIYNYKQVDALIRYADANGLKLTLIWFASWKNGKSSYLPLWVKRNQRKYLRAKAKESTITTERSGLEADFISTFSDATCKADAKAFAALMKHIKQVDKNKVVILMQVENEVGLFQDIDYCKAAQKAYKQEVPQELLDYLKLDKKGTWEEVFGASPLTKEKFMAWHYATYINEVAARGKEEYNLPMYVNAWIMQKPTDLPGTYPNGGPVARVIDIYKAAAPAIDFVSPDIYLPNLKEVIAKYHRVDNPLFVPEARIKPENLFYTIAKHNALGFSPFGIEDGIGDYLYAESNNVLHQLMPQLLLYQGKNKVTAFAKNEEEEDEILSFGDYQLHIHYLSKEEPCFGLLIQTGKDQFIVSGMNVVVTFVPKDKTTVALVGQIVEGTYDKEGMWQAGRMLNGDEGVGLKLLKVKGVDHKTAQYDKAIDPNAPVAPDSYSANKWRTVTTPGIYKVEMYQLKK